MNLSPRWVAVLQQAGFDAVHWSAIGPFDAADAQLMAYAAQHDCVVLTQGLDFSAILAATQGDKPSVVQVRSDDVNPDSIGAQVIAALRQMATELEQGALVSVDPARVRVRVLPLRADS